MATLIAVDGKAQPALALDLPEFMLFDDWVDLGRKLSDGQKVVNWWIGDWWAAGDHRYGERAKVAAEHIFGREFQTLANLASVCRSFETSRRREVLSWSHHAEVASLPVDEADALLDQAERDSLPVNKLRTAARLRKIDLGILKPADVNDDDVATRAGKKIQYIWNEATTDVREYIFDALKQAADNGFEDLDL
jgi:hypothetical protein